MSDNNISCESWAKRGECETNPAYMTNQCSRSCDDLRKKEDQCKIWANKGECEANPTYMISQCSKACDAQKRRHMAEAYQKKMAESFRASTGEAPEGKSEAAVSKTLIAEVVTDEIVEETKECESPVVEDIDPSRKKRLMAEAYQKKMSDSFRVSTDETEGKIEASEGNSEAAVSEALLAEEITEEIKEVVKNAGASDGSEPETTKTTKTNTAASIDKILATTHEVVSSMKSKIKGALNSFF